MDTSRRLKDTTTEWVQTVGASQRKDMPEWVERLRMHQCNECTDDVQGDAWRNLVADKYYCMYTDKGIGFSACQSGPNSEQMYGKSRAEY